MGEKYGVSKGESITYEGPLRVKDTIKQVKNWIEENGYGWNEKEHIETISPDGKYIEISAISESKLTDYAKHEIKLKIKFENIKDKVVDKQRMQTGKFSLTIDAALLTDYAERWKDDKPALYLLRVFFEKYIYSPYAEQMKKDLREDVDALKHRISAYLNLFRYAP